MDIYVTFSYILHMMLISSFYSCGDIFHFCTCYPSKFDEKIYEIFKQEKDIHSHLCISEPLHMEKE